MKLLIDKLHTIFSQEDDGETGKIGEIINNFQVTFDGNVENIVERLKEVDEIIWLPGSKDED